MSTKRNTWVVFTMTAALAALAASGCQLPGNASAQNVGLSAPFSMQGSWVSVCRGQGQNSSSYVIEKLTVQGTTFTDEQDYYTDSKCATASTGNQVLSGTFVDQGASQVVPTAEDVDFAIVAVVITGTGSQPGGPSAGMTYYALVEVQGNQLFMGKDDNVNNGSSPNLRAVQIDLTDPMTKQ